MTLSALCIDDPTISAVALVYRQSGLKLFHVIRTE
jgi:hypothetical protein